MKKQFPDNGLTMVDLFCGAGIGAIGFRYAGYNIIDAIDNVKFAVETYNLNIGNHARVEDIKKLTDIPDADVIAGGWPCTPFSVGGAMRGEKDEKLGNLGYHFYRIIRDKQPKAFLAENVNGIVSEKNIDFFNKLLVMFKEAGYNVSWRLMNLWEYGVPQTRKRVFIVGFRKDLGLTFEDSWLKVLPTEQRKTLRDAIGDLPDPESNHNIKNHKEYYKGGYSSRYLTANRQRQWNEPSFTIVSTARQLPLHPEPPNYDIRRMDEYDTPPPRRLTVRECLRIQTVPDWFYFPDHISFEKQHQRCSGIPSMIAYKLGLRIAKLLLKK